MFQEKESFFANIDVDILAPPFNNIEPWKKKEHLFQISYGTVIASWH